MTTYFHAGFCDELTKQAGIRDIVKRIVNGKEVPKMGFFEKRRLAKVLGVKGKEVPKALLERQKKDRLTKGLMAGAGLTLGSMAGASLNKEAEGVGLTSKMPKMTMGPRGAGPSGMAAPKPPAPAGGASGGGLPPSRRGTVGPPDAKPMTPKLPSDPLAKRDALMAQRGFKADNHTPGKTAPKVDPLLAKRDALQASRGFQANNATGKAPKAQDPMLAKRDALMKSRSNPAAGMAGSLAAR